jgi:hypothetical protein
VRLRRVRSDESVGPRPSCGRRSGPLHQKGLLMIRNGIETWRRRAPGCGLRPMSERDRERRDVLVSREHMVRLAVAAQSRRAVGRGRGRSVGGVAVSAPGDKARSAGEATTDRAPAAPDRVGTRPDRERRVDRSGAHRLRRPDAGAWLQRRHRLPAEQARRDHVHPRPGRRAPRRPGHGEHCPPGHVHGHRHGA